MSECIKSNKLKVCDLFKIQNLSFKIIIMNRFLFFLVVGLLFFSCKNTEKAKQTTTQTPPPKQQQIQVQGKQLYPSVPLEKIQSLWNDCDYVDYSYINLPLSMNRKDLNDIRHTLAQISEQPALINDRCPAIGNILFYQKGEIALEANIYYSQGCNYFVFLENNKPKYANFMTPSGIAFFKDIMDKFSKMQKQ